jgi:hypothetical protein
MRGLIGFGSPFVAALWAVLSLSVVLWLIGQLLQRRPVTLLSSLIVFVFFLPIILQYPFTFSAINSLTIGVENYTRYRPQVDSAFLITITGLAVLLVGYAVCGRRDSELVPMTLVASGLRVWTGSVFLHLSSIFILVLFGLLAALGLLGAGGARNIAQSNPAVRPFYNLAHILLPLVVALDLFVGIQRRRRMILLLAIINLGLAALTGTRSAAFGGITLFAMAILVHASLLKRLRIAQALKLIPVALAILIAAIYLADVREGQYNPLQTLATFGAKLFYGNTYSDLRDFAWVKSYWDGTYYLGRTQAAGFLAFIPSAISSFRLEWNWGVVTTNLTGLDPVVNPGLRTGIFGEMYFNFGLPGVIVSAFLYGYFIRRVHNVILLAARTLPKYDGQLAVFAGLVTVSIAGSLLNTAGFFGFYITIAVLGGLQVLDYLVRAGRNARNEAVASWAAGQASRS